MEQPRFMIMFVSLMESKDIFKDLSQLPVLGVKWLWIL
jgi:hypothetical protein